MSKKKATDVKTDKTNEDKPVNVTEETKASDKVETVNTDAVDKNVPTEDVTYEQMEEVDSKTSTYEDITKDMEDERNELNDRVTALASYVHENPEFNDKGRLEQALLYGQLKAMQTYLHMLTQRSKL